MPAITGSAGDVVPNLVSAVASDASGSGLGIQNGDQLVLTFDAPTNAYAVTTSNIDTVLAVAGRTWSTVDSAVWSTTDAANDTLTVTFGTNVATVAVGDDITIGTGTVQNASATMDALGSPPAISGTFGEDDTAPTITITAPEEGDFITETSVTVTGSVSDSDTIASATVNGQPVDPAGFSAEVDLDEEGAHAIYVRAIDIQGNYAEESLTVYRDTEYPEVIDYDLPDALRPGRLDITLTFWDAVSGLDTTVSPTVTLSITGGDVLTFTQDSFDEDGVWKGHVVIPPFEALPGYVELKATDAADLAGNVMESPWWEQVFKIGGPSISVTTAGSYVSPAYVTGTKGEDGMEVWWRYTESNPSKWGLDTTKWHEVDEDGNGLCAHESWWTEIPLHVAKKDGDLIWTDLGPGERTVSVEFCCVDSLGQGTKTEVALVWQLAVIGEDVPGNGKPAHLIQKGEKMVFSARKSTCQVQGITRDLVRAEIWGDDGICHEGPYAEEQVNMPNVVHQFNTEGRNWEVESGFACIENREPIPDTHYSTRVHVIKKLQVALIAAWPGDTLPSSVADWLLLTGQAILNYADWGWTVPSNTQYALLAVPTADRYSDWADYDLQEGTKAMAPWWWSLFTESKRFWWTKRMTKTYNDYHLCVSHDEAVLAHEAEEMVRPTPMKMDIWNGGYEWRVKGDEWATTAANANPVADAAQDGAFTVANKNDTDNDGVIDTEDDYIPGEVDMMKLVITPPNPIADSVNKITLTVKGVALAPIRFWSTPDKMDFDGGCWSSAVGQANGQGAVDIPVVRPKQSNEELPPVAFICDKHKKASPVTLFVECTDGSLSVRDIELTLTCDREPEIPARATAVWAYCRRAWYSTAKGNLDGKLKWPHSEDAPAAFWGELGQEHGEERLKYIVDSNPALAGAVYDYNTRNSDVVHYIQLFVFPGPTPTEFPQLPQEMGAGIDHGSAYILMRFRVFPDDVWEEPTVKFDVTRRVSLRIKTKQLQEEEWTGFGKLDVPPGDDVANDDAAEEEADVESSQSILTYEMIRKRWDGGFPRPTEKQFGESKAYGTMWSFDAPGLPNNKAGELGEYRYWLGAEEFVRVRFDGKEPKGGTRKKPKRDGVRCSYKLLWEQEMWLERGQDNVWRRHGNIGDENNRLEVVPYGGPWSGPSEDLAE